MKRRHAVSAVGEMNVHIRHVHASVLVNDGHAFILRLFPYYLIQFPDDRHKLRHDLFKIFLRPLLQSFRQNRVVRVGACLRYDFHRLLKGNTLFHQKPYKLRYYHRRMSIINLDCSIIRKVMERAPSLDALLQYHLRPCAHHKILLVDPKFPSCLVTVVRVQEKGKVFGNVLLIKADAFLNNALIHRIKVKEVQLVGTALISGHI